MKAILADMNSTELVVKIRPEVMSQSGRGHGFKSRKGLNFFQVLFTTTSLSSVLSCEDLLISALLCLGLGVRGFTLTGALLPREIQSSDAVN